MKQSDSAILKLLNTLNQEELEKTYLSDEYYEALNKYTEKNQLFENKIKNDLKLLELHRDVLDTLQYENVVYANDMFKAAFTIGLAIGQEVFGKKFD
ncbi:MAG: hypothetical protein K2L70_07265 [Clostridia bacterium]|nr:hypothetical protein [Clostridia bacterium]